MNEIHNITIINTVCEIIFFMVKLYESVLDGNK